jgi:hypothetical protein
MLSLIYTGTSEGAEKAAPKPVSKAAPATAAQQQYGGVLKIIEINGPKTPFGWPAETVGESVVASIPAIETLVRQY